MIFNAVGGCVNPYPVGAIYLSAAATSPASLFGGTWERLKDRFLLGAGDTYTVGSTGGEAKHTLTVNEMPSHKHSTTYVVKSEFATQVGSGGTTALSGGSASITTEYSGGDQPHNNMPPYLAVYMWKRVA